MSDEITLFAFILFDINNPIEFSSPKDVHSFFQSEHLHYENNAGYTFEQAVEDYNQILSYVKKNKRYPWIHVCPFTQEIDGIIQLIFSDSEDEASRDFSNSAGDI